MLETIVTKYLSLALQILQQPIISVFYRNENEYIPDLKHDYLPNINRFSQSTQYLFLQVYTGIRPRALAAIQLSFIAINLSKLAIHKLVADDSLPTNIFFPGSTCKRTSFFRWWPNDKPSIKDSPCQ